MGITKTDFMRGMQCPKMLWLDRHHPELKVIPPEVRDRLDRGNEFGDLMMGYFGPYTEVREYYPGTTRPDKPKMAEKTQELLLKKTPVICEAAFLDGDGNYCAADILRYDSVSDVWDLIEVKNSAELREQFVADAGYQAWLIRRTGLSLRNVSVLYHADEPCIVTDVTDRAAAYAQAVEENIGRLSSLREQKQEITAAMGMQCSEPYACWYTGYCEAERAGLLDRKRCSWCGKSNPRYLIYHDMEWGVPCHDDRKLFEMLVLESFQAGLSWECVLNKRPAFREAFDEFEPSAVARYDTEKEEALLHNSGIIRHRGKIHAAVQNAAEFLKIQEEFGCFDAYLRRFTGDAVVYESDPAVTTSPLSDAISADLKKRGMCFVGSTIVYSFLQAIGVIDAHSPECWKYRGIGAQLEIRG